MSEQAHFRGIADANDRLLVFSVNAYAFGISVALYAMTHCARQASLFRVSLRLPGHRRTT